MSGTYRRRRLWSLALAAVVALTIVPATNARLRVAARAADGVPRAPAATLAAAICEPGGADPARAVTWFRLDPVLDDGGALAGQRLVAGSAERRRAARAVARAGIVRVRPDRRAGRRRFGRRAAVHHPAPRRGRAAASRGPSRRRISSGGPSSTRPARRCTSIGSTGGAGPVSGSGVDRSTDLVAPSRSWSRCRRTSGSASSSQRSCSGATTARPSPCSRAAKSRA